MTVEVHCNVFEMQVHSCPSLNILAIEQEDLEPRLAPLAIFVCPKANLSHIALRSMYDPSSALNSSPTLGSWNGRECVILKDTLPFFLFDPNQELRRGCHSSPRNSGCSSLRKTDKSLARDRSICDMESLRFCYTSL